MNRRITVEEIMSKHPCKEWTRELVEEQIGEGKTLTEILDLDIEAFDRIWAVVWFLPEEINRTFAIWCARQCETDVTEISDYIDTIESCYNDQDKLKEADMAAVKASRKACDVDSNAYWAAHRAAERDPVKAAYWAAGRAVYSTAYSGAYWEPARAAAKAEMQERLIKKLKELIQEAE